MGIQINGQNDTVSASDGSINISGEITANVINQTVTGVTTFTDATFTNGFNVTGVVTATSFTGSGANLTNLTGASAATYGDASNVAQIVVDADGRITSISEVTISGGGGGGSGPDPVIMGMIF